MSGTVCMWRYLPLSQFLGGGYRSARFSNFCYPSPHDLFCLFLPCIYFVPRYNINHANANVGILTDKVYRIIRKG